jgi:ribonuclease D
VSEVLRLTTPVPDVVDSGDGLERAVADLASGRGPLGVDAERAGSYRYSQRAYLVQVYRRGAAVLLLDPITIDDFAPLARLLASEEWVMQAAHNDLSCLAEIDLVPTRLFDTEVAAQLLGLEKVGLASLVESQLGYEMRKSHGQADWSHRPLRQSWLEYAALDVTVLPDLQDALAEELDLAGKTDWAQQEFAHQLRDRDATDPAQRWRRTNTAGRLRTNAQRGALKELWALRDELARSRDIAWHRVVRDQVLVEIARELPTTAADLAAVPNLPRPLLRNSQQWLAAIAEGVANPVAPTERLDGPPTRSLRAWEQRDPEAAARWTDLRSRLAERAEDLQVWTQTLLAPDIVADLAWAPPPDPAARMAQLGARPWQVENTRDLFESAADPE